jgi:hypothetical protein
MRFPAPTERRSQSGLCRDLSLQSADKQINYRLDAEYDRGQSQADSEEANAVAAQAITARRALDPATIRKRFAPVGKKGELNWCAVL